MYWFDGYDSYCNGKMLISVHRLIIFSDGQCNGIIIGNVTNDELSELSGLAESHRFPEVFYSIQDSGNKPSVYVINQDGTLRG